MNDHIHQEIARDALKEPDRKDNPILMKIITYIVAGILLLLIVGYFVPYRVIPIIEGRIASSTVEGDTIYHNEKTIVFENFTYDYLKGVFNANQKAEFKACLIGERKANKFTISQVQLPRTISSSVFHVHSVSCPRDAIISLHSHPREHCLFSEQDKLSYEKRSNPDSIIAVMCSEDRFNFYP